MLTFVTIFQKIQEDLQKHDKENQYNTMIINQVQHWKKSTKQILNNTNTRQD